MFFRACFQISQNPSGVGDFLEDFLSKWRFVNDRYYDVAVDHMEGSNGRFSLGVDEYLYVVEFYVMKLLDTELAISWVEKADLPEDRRQVNYNTCILFLSASTAIL